MEVEAEWQKKKMLVRSTRGRRWNAREVGERKAWEEERSRMRARGREIETWDEVFDCEGEKTRSLA
jgi:hypothetical protein